MRGHLIALLNSLLLALVVAGSNGAFSAFCALFSIESGWVLAHPRIAILRAFQFHDRPVE